MTSRPQSVSEAHGDSATETEDEDTAGASSSSQVVGDAEACRQLNQEELLSRVRKMNEELEATRIPLHDVPVSLVVDKISSEKKAATWSRLCDEGGRSNVAEHIGRVIRASAASTSERALTWEAEYPRSRYRGYFKPPIFDDEPSDSSGDEEAHAADK